MEKLEDRFLVNLSEVSIPSPNHEMFGLYISRFEIIQFTIVSAANVSVIVNLDPDDGILVNQIVLPLQGIKSSRNFAICRGLESYNFDNTPA